MKPIRILTPVLDLLAEIDDYESLLFTRRWHDVGEFELRISRHKQHTELLQRGNLIMLGASRNKVGIIKHREIVLDEGGKASETWLVKGIALKGVMSQRLVVPPASDSHDRAIGAVETVMKHYVDSHIVNPVDMKRKIDMVTIAPDQQRGLSMSWESRFQNLADELAEISKASGLGWDVFLDFQQKKWIFDVFEGRNLTVNQTENPQSLPENEIIEKLQQRGQQKLDEFTQEFYLEGQVLTNSPFKYETDFDLGDIVTIQNKDWNVTRDARITEIKEIYEQNGFQIEATFGESRPTLIKRLKQELSQISGEVRK